MSEGVESEVFSYEQSIMNLHRLINNSLYAYNLHKRKYFRDSSFSIDDCIEVSLRWASLVKPDVGLDLILYYHNNETICGLTRMNKYFYMISNFNSSSNLMEFRRITEQRSVIPEISFFKERLKTNTSDYNIAFSSPIDFIIKRDKFNPISGEIVNKITSSMDMGGMMGVLQTFYRVRGLQEYLSNTIFKEIKNEEVSFILSNDGTLPLYSEYSKILIIFPHWTDLKDTMTYEAIEFILNSNNVKTPQELFKVIHGSKDGSFGRDYIRYTLSNSPEQEANLSIFVVACRRSRILSWGAYLTEIIVSISILFILLSFLIAFCFSCCITFPIRKVAKDMKKLSHLEISKRKNRISAIQPIEVRKMIASLETMKNCIMKLKLYLPSHVIGMLIKETTLKPFMIKQYLTVSFSDIVGFSTFSNQLTSHQLLRIMSDFYIYTTECVQRNGGWIIELLGDALFVVYGLNDKKGKKNKNKNDELYGRHALAAVRTCMEMDKILHRQNPFWNSDNLPSIQMRHGIATGEAWCGCVGNARRMQFTAIGTPVQKAHALESLGKILCDPSSSILIDERAFGSIPKHIFDISWVAPFGGYSPESHIYRVNGLFESDSYEDRDFFVDMEYLRRTWNARLYDRVVRFSKITMEKWKEDKYKINNVSYIKELAELRKKERESLMNPNIDLKFRLRT